MLQTCLLTVLCIGTTRSQFLGDMGMRADMTFDDDNERYDVGNIIKEQNRMYREAAPVNDNEDYRRHGRSEEAIPLYEVIKYNRRRLANQRKRNMNRRSNYNAEDQIFDNEDDSYNRKLSKFKALNGRKQLQVIDLEQYLKRQEDKLEDQNPYYRRNFRYRRDRGGEASINDVGIGKAKAKGELDKIDSAKLKATFDNVAQGVDEKKKIEEAVLKYLHPDTEAAGDNKKPQVTDEENLLLLRNAVPINLEVNGYLEVP